MKLTSIIRDRQLAFLVCLLGLSILPAIRVFFEIVSSCSNSPSTDDFHAITLVDQLLHGPPIAPLDFLNRTIQSPHIVVLTILAELAIVGFTNWSEKLHLLVGFSLTVLSLPLEIWALAGPQSSTKMKLAISAVVIPLTFSASLASCVFNGQGCIAGGLYSLVFSFLIWTSTRNFNSVALKTFALIAAMILCTLNGPHVFIYASTVLAISCLFDFQKKNLFASGLAVITSLPLALFLYKLVSVTGANGSPNFINFDFFINAVGRLFCNDVAYSGSSSLDSTLSGCLGLVLVIVCTFAQTKIKRPCAQVAGPFCYMTLALVCTYAISCFRPAISPWYTFYSHFFWVGLAALAIHFLFLKNPSSPRFKKLCTIIGVLTLSTIAYFYGYSNIKYADKDLCRDTHCPASESSLRNYKIAPTYAEYFVNFGGSHHGFYPVIKLLAAPLEKNGWGPFSKNQIWHLQGDFVLPTVQVQSDLNHNVSWIKGRRADRPITWKFAENLNLNVPPGCSISWQLVVPDNTSAVTFQTAVAAPIQFKKHKQKESMSCQIIILNNDSNALLASKNIVVNNHWADVSLPLKGYGGQTIKIILSVDGATAGGAVFRDPRLSVDYTKVPAYHDVTPVPSNTSESPFFPVNLKTAMRFKIADSAPDWTITGATSGPSKDGHVVYGANNMMPQFSLNSPVNVPANHLQFLTLGIKQFSDVSISECCIQLTINSSRVQSIVLPLSKDNTFKNYFYDLKLLELKPEDRITGVKVLPLYLQNQGHFQLSDLALLPRASK